MLMPGLGFLMLYSNNQAIKVLVAVYILMLYSNNKAINPLSAMVAIWHHIIVSFQVFGTERVHWNFGYFRWNGSVRGSLGQRVSFDWWMLAEWAVRDKQPILPTSTNPCITRAARTQGVSGSLYSWPISIFNVLHSKFSVSAILWQITIFRCW
jgi:hypothetical protein